jgi:hypothetical protein
MLVGDRFRNLPNGVWFTRSRNANRTLLRRLTDVCDHAGKASHAAAIAASTSSREARTTSADCCPVAGLYTAAVRTAAAAVVIPLAHGG